MRKFEKVSYTEYKKEVNGSIDEYNSYNIPRRKTKNSKANSLLYFAVVLIIVAILLYFDIKNMTSVGKKIKESKNEDNIEVVEEETTAPEEEKGKIYEFNTFVDKEYTKEEIENMSASEASNIYNLEKNNDLKIDKALGSAGDEDYACVVASSAYSTDNQFVKATEIVDETDLYYIVGVTYDYINQNVAKRYTQNVLVFKKFYYNSETDTFNVDDVKNVKIILDLKNYITNYSNAGKVLVQSFMEKNGQQCEYVLYYLDVNYAEENKNASANLIKEVTTINAASGKVEEKTTQTVKSNLVL